MSKDTFDVKMLVIQRKERYPGEYGPEVLAAVDEHTDTDNPDWFIEECRKQLDACGNDVEAHAYVAVAVPYADVMAALRPPDHRTAARRLTGLGDPDAISDAFDVLVQVADSGDGTNARAARQVLEQLGAEADTKGRFGKTGDDL